MGCSKESFRILAGCTNSGKSKKGIQKALDTGITKEFSHQERLEKLNEFYLDSAKSRIQRVERYRKEWHRCEARRKIEKTRLNL